MSWTEAINSLKEHKPHGAQNAVYARALAWLEARQVSHPDPRPTCLIVDESEGLCIDFRSGWDRELQWAAEFHADGTAELQKWEKGEIVNMEAIQ